MARTIRRFDDNDHYDTDRYEVAISRFLETVAAETVFVPIPEERRRTRRFAKEARRKARVAA